MVAFLAAAALALSAPQPIAITHVSVVHVENGLIESNVTVLLSGDAIKAVGTNVPLQNATIVDGAGKFLIPGLWDMHVHCDNADDHFFPLFLYNGVTGIRDMGGVLDDLKTCRSNLESGALLGPRLVFAGPIVDGPKPVWPDISIAAGTPAEGRAAVATVQQGGADFVKVYSLLPRDVYFAIADEAHRRHIDFAGHVPDSITAAEASAASQKSFEHLLSVLQGCSSREMELLSNRSLSESKQYQTMLDSYDPAKAAALFATFRKNHTWQCPTLVVLNSFAHGDAPAYLHDPRLALLPDEVVSYWKSPFHRDYKSNDWAITRSFNAKLRETLGAMAKSGVGILAGSDTPNPGVFPGFGLHDELSLLVQSGLTPLQALQTATINPARYFGWENKMGTIRPGNVADLVLLDANPLDDITNAARIRAVFVRGHYLNRAALDRLLTSAKPFHYWIPTAIGLAILIFLCSTIIRRQMRRKQSAHLAK